MKAMLLRQPKPVEENPLGLAEVPDPQPGPGQVRVRVSACGVCHTDLHTVEGELKAPRLPLIPGHEIVGVIDALGDGATLHHTGDRVGIGWINGSCGACAFCTRGLENLCPQARFTGLDADGGYAQYTVVDEEFAYPIPAGIDDEHAAPLLCAGIIGYRALRLSEIEPGGRLGLYGFGASAHIAIQVARHWDCEVHVFTRSEEHRAHARELGATWAGAAADTPPHSLDAAITFTPAGEIIPLALGHLTPGGVLAINAVYMTPIPELPYRLIYGERTVRSVSNFTRQDALEFLPLAAAIPIHTDVELFSLHEANRVLQRMKRSKVRGAAVLRIP